MRASKPTRIVASVLSTAVLVAACAPAAGARPLYRRYGHTPSGNIRCQASNYGGPAWSLVCSTVHPHRTVRITTHGHAYKAPYSPVGRRGRTLHYGHVYHLGPYECSSFQTYLYCETSDGSQAFSISRQGIRVYN